ncbi:hypothetical protein O6H91_10G009700 [Diphasiastrum complanatum]|uniref:Uncharacterized protein n=1 Tax=Diphasiastrum complanatum TaxID=34168 RepID=A0ACC2CEB6_DIPCM|nr:hypothetical protein O6H91_10G009700 [Diphasiastrum complanatum]
MNFFSTVCILALIVATVCIFTQEFPQAKSPTLSPLSPSGHLEQLSVLRNLC